jgi:hypothetical protein
MPTYYVRTDGSDSNAGTSDTSGGAWLTIAYANSQIVAGDTVYVRGIAGNAASFPTSSFDYTISSALTGVAGSLSVGRTRWIGIGSMPTIGTPGAAWSAFNHATFDNLYFCASNNTGGGGGFLGGANCEVLNCVFNMNLKTSMVGLKLNTSTVVNCTIYGGGTSPTLSAGCHGIISDNYSNYIQSCRIMYCRENGIHCNAGGNIRECKIYGCAGNGITFASASTCHSNATGNTIHGNAGMGIYFSSTDNAGWAIVRNNIITNHLQSGKYGISCTASSDLKKLTWGYNNVWNNTGNYSNVTASATDLSVDPQFVDAANGDFTPQNAALMAAFPLN